MRVALPAVSRSSCADASRTRCSSLRSVARGITSSTGTPVPFCHRRHSPTAKHLRARALNSDSSSRHRDDTVESELMSLQNLGLDDIGLDIEELSSDIGIVDSTETMSLNREFGIPTFVRVTDGRGGLPKVTLTHPSGASCDVYLHGANILSWELPNGGEVFYTPDGIEFSEAESIEWGTSFCFPQFGQGGEHPGAPSTEIALPIDGFAKNMKWSIVQTGLHEDKCGEYPYLTIAICDTEITRSIWNHNFYLIMEISLENDALNVSTTFKNTGGEVLEFASALKSHIAVADIEDSTTSYIGLEDCIYLDNTLHPTKPRVRFTDENDNQEWLQLEGPTDRIYLNTGNSTGVEVGTGCTVYARDLSPNGVEGFSDRGVFNPWKENDRDHYRWYAGLAIGAMGKLVKVEPGMKHMNKVRFEVLDEARTQTLKRRRVRAKKHALRKMTKRPKYDLLADELPNDLQ